MITCSLVVGLRACLVLSLVTSHYYFVSVLKAEVSHINKTHGDLEEIRRQLGLSKRKIAQLLLPFTNLLIEKD